jgi:hypothetical protein
MTIIKITAFCTLISFSSGCSFVGIRRIPDEEYNQDQNDEDNIEPVECAGSSALPYIDAAITILLGASMISSAIDDNDTSHGDNSFNAIGDSAALFSLFPILVFGASSVYGFNTINRCQ